MPTKKLIERIALSIIVIFIFQNSFCQENYLPGYIISQNGDTLHGFIDYRNWEINPNKIFFKERLNGDRSNYTPVNIKGFRVLDESYESAIIQSEISPFKTNELLPVAELKIEIDTIFLQTMIMGAKDLFFYKNNDGKEQFYIKQDSSYELLIYKKYLKEFRGYDLKVDKGDLIIAENKKYLGQLSLYLQDCPTIQSKLKNTEYKKKSMENLFLNYYDCIQSGNGFHKKTEKISTEFGIVAGLSMTTLNFSSGAFYNYLVNAQFDLSENFSAGLFVDFVLPRNQRKWSFYIELNFTSYKVNGRFNDYKNENNYTITSTTIGMSYLKMNSMFRFKYPIGGLFVYLNAGMTNGYAISETNYKKIERLVYSTKDVKESKALDELKKYELGYILGLGTGFKKYFFEIRYERGNGMSTYSTLNSSTKRYSFLLGYRF